MAVEGYLRKIVVDGSFMKSVILSPADLSGANFRNADLSRANLVDANLVGTNFTYADLTNATLPEEPLDLIAAIGEGGGLV